MNIFKLILVGLISFSSLSYAKLSEEQWKNVYEKIQESDGYGLARVLKGVVLEPAEKEQLLEVAKDMIQKRYTEWKMSPGLGGRMIRFAVYLSMMCPTFVFGGVTVFAIAHKSLWSIPTGLLTLLCAYKGFAGMGRAYSGPAAKEALYQDALMVKHIIAKQMEVTPK